MTTFLYRMGRWSARRPWTVIGLWALAAVLVVAASASFGRELEDSFEAPGVDSQIAVDLLSEAGSERAGLTARVVATPLADGVDFTSDDARDDLDEVAAAVAGLGHVLGVAESMSPDATVALLTVQYPVMEDLTVADLERLEDAVVDVAAETSLQVEAGGELFFAFDDGGGGGEELIGLAAAVVILLLAFGSLIAMGLPIGIAIFGLALGIAAMPLIGHIVTIPSWAREV